MPNVLREFFAKAADSSKTGHFLPQKTLRVFPALASATALCLLALRPVASQTLPPANTPRQLPSSVFPNPSILPTDILPSNLTQDRTTLGESLNIRLLQNLPAPLYFTQSTEATFRYETNPYQFPTKRTLLRSFPNAQQRASLSAAQNAQLNGQLSGLLSRASAAQMIFRVLPNTTVGWALNNRTRVFANHFLLRDAALKDQALSTTVNSFSAGIQRDIPVGSRANLQLDMQFRELLQSRQQPVFDYLPGVTLTYIANPRTVLFVNTLVQMRGKKPFQAPTKEIDPFYSFGGLYTRNGWNFSASSTFVQNFREPFGRNAIIRQDNYSWILDFEVARRLMKQVPGLQGFVRAEPIYNFHSRNTPGLAGMDFRLFFGIRTAMAKRPLTGVIDQIREDLMEQEEQNQPTKPSARIPQRSTIVAAPPPAEDTKDIVTTEPIFTNWSPDEEESDLESPLRMVLVKPAEMEVTN